MFFSIPFAYFVDFLIKMFHVKHFYNLIYYFSQKLQNKYMFLQALYGK